MTNQLYCCFPYITKLHPELVILLIQNWKISHSRVVHFDMLIFAYANFSRSWSCSGMDKTREKTLVKPQSAKSRPLCFNKHCSLTGLSIYAILLKTTQYKANRAEYSTTLRGSHPTLMNPVHGLRHIIFHHRTSGLDRLSGSTDSSLCRFSCFLFGFLRRCGHA